MLGRAKIRLALISTLLSGLVVVLLGAFALSLAKSQYSLQSESAFIAAVKGIAEKLRSDRSVTAEWLSQTELNGELVLFIYDAGAPLSFAGAAFTGEKRAALESGALSEALRLGAEMTAPALGETEEMQFELESGGELYRAYIYKTAAEPPWYSFIALQNKTAEREPLAALTRLYILLCGAALLALAALSFIFVHIALLPVKHAAKKQNEFIAAASHELKTPLAVIRASAAAIAAKPKEAAKMTQNIESECARLGALIDDLLTLSGADAGTWRVSFAEIEPDTLILNLCESLEPLCRKSGHTITPVIENGAIPKIMGDRARIEQILTVLVNNALCYTSPCEIKVGAAKHGKGVELTVSDKGPGIPDSEKARIFDRFYRADKSRTDKNHFGLGLSVARELARLHKGTLTVRDCEGGGACFALTISGR